MIKKIVLASQSPRRKQLLEWAEVEFDIIIQSSPEDFPAEMSVEDVPVHIARNKALAVAADSKYRSLADKPIILAADTVVVLDGEIIGKPHDREEAVSILTRLSGRIHHVITGVVLLNDAHEKSFSDSTAVWFNELTQEEIEFYVDKYKPFDKAGAYAIQEWIGVVGIQRIEGDFYNVMGLPVSRVIQALKEIHQ
ncbi:MAG: septum formation protein Maf [Chitinophagaceae bacterium]|nr:septum formation protein Maf [Chitinophagaceae bacterium]